MIVARDVFQVKFGQMDAVLAAMKAAAASGNFATDYRIMTDVSGRLFTLVVESTWDSVDAHREAMMASFQDAEANARMGPIMEWMESGRREYYHIEQESGG